MKWSYEPVAQALKHFFTFISLHSSWLTSAAKTKCQELFIQVSGLSQSLILDLSQQFQSVLVESSFDYWRKTDLLCLGCCRRHRYRNVDPVPSQDSSGWEKNQGCLRSHLPFLFTFNTSMNCPRRGRDRRRESPPPHTHIPHPTYSHVWKLPFRLLLPPPFLSPHRRDQRQRKKNKQLELKQAMGLVFSIFLLLQTKHLQCRNRSYKKKKKTAAYIKRGLLFLFIYCSASPLFCQQREESTQRGPWRRRRQQQQPCRQSLGGVFTLGQIGSWLPSGTWCSCCRAQDYFYWSLKLFPRRQEKSSRQYR